MNKRLFKSFLGIGALATACAAWGCVADRPARNGVFNENQYVRKDFLVRSGDNGSVDPGWIFRSTILATSAPNPLAPLGLFVGADNSGGDGSAPGINYVRFAITEDKLQMINMRELSAGYPAQGSRDSEVVNAWPATSVDLKYRVNLDGETSNFYEENQELDWQVRQWVKLSFDKNDMSDLAPLGTGTQGILAQCTDVSSASTTLVPNSFIVDEVNNYLSWQIQLTVPINFSDSACTDAYGVVGVNFQDFGRSNVTMTLEYSLARAAPDSGIARADGSPSNYVPLVLGEKDPIRKKYGVFENVVWNRDTNTGLLAAQELLNRYNPNAEFMDWYLAEGYPSQYEAMWTNPGGIVDQTNQIFADAGARLRMRVWRFDDMTDNCTGGPCTFGNDANPSPKLFGDVRYNFVHWVSDLDVADGPGFAGFTPSLNDPRTGERISTVINMADFPLYDYYVTELDYYLQTIGAEQNVDATGNWPAITTPCVVGDTFPLGGLVDSTIATQHNEISTVYDKMQLYLHKDATTYGYLSPSDFIPQENDDFFKAFFKIIPYEVFKDPATNPFVIPEGGAGSYAPGGIVRATGGMQYGDYQTRSEFHSLMQVVNDGYSPYASASYTVGGQTVNYTPPQAAAGYDGSGGQGDVAAAAAFNGQVQSLRQAVFAQQYTQAYSPYGRVLDNTDILTNFKLFEKDSRHCVWNNPQHSTAPLSADIQKCSQAPSGSKTHWECRSEYLDSLVQSYWTQTVWHEFGHAVGLRHNFMSSLDRNNFPTWTDVNGNTHIGLYASSLMEYNSTPDRLFFAGGAAQGNANGGPWANSTTGSEASQATAANAGAAPTHMGNWNGLPGWAPYDIGAVSFIYGNNRTAYTGGTIANAGTASTGKVQVGPNGTPVPFNTISGQTSATTPWNDPNGWNFANKTEIQYLFCTDEDLRYSPFCRQGDFGTTPSEIIASAIDRYEWNYKWRNFRLYHKFWNDGPYADTVAAFFGDLTRFLSTWAYDWNGGELINNFPRIGVEPPPGVPLATYYGDLNSAFNNDISVANQLVAAFHEAIIQQSSGERPFISTYDPFYGDVIQQGIILDKLYAMQDWTTLSQISNYDPTQAAGAYLFDATGFDANYQDIAENTLLSMLGGQYDVFAYFVPLAIANFAQASHDVNFTARTELRDWVGGQTFGSQQAGGDGVQSFLDYVHNLAQQANAYNIDPVVFAGCVQGQPLDSCAWDPRIAQTDSNDVYHSDAYNDFRGPDDRRYVWTYLPDQNVYYLVDRDRNIASYVTMINYNADVYAQHDDGDSGAYYLELPIKYTFGYFNQYNSY
jgi:hypothetical protein